MADVDLPARRLVLTMAQRQLGLVATWQLLERSIARHQVESLRRGGWIDSVRRGVWMVAGAPPHNCHDIAAAVLAGGRTAAASRGSALAIRPGLPSRGGSPPHVVSHGLIDLEGVVCHRARNLVAADLTTVQTIRTVTFGRAVIELIGEPDVHWTWVARLLDGGCRLWGDRALDSVEAALERAGARGYKGVARLRLLVAERREDGPQDRYRLQRKWMRLIDDAGLGGIDEYHVIIDGTDRWLDRAWPDHKVCVEVKGFWGVHGDRSAFDSDAERESALASAGWTVFGITSRTHAEILLARLRRALDPELRGVCQEPGRQTPRSW